MRLEINQLHRPYSKCRIANAARQSQLVASLAREGQLFPVVVIAAEHPETETATPDAGKAGPMPSPQPPRKYLLIDGYGRVAALEQLARDTVEATVLDTTPTDALVSHRFGATRRPCVLEEAWLLSALLNDHGLSPARLALLLDRSKSWVSRRLGLVDALPESVQRAVQLGRLSPQVAMKYLLPLARANTPQCSQLAAGLKGSPTVRQMAALYRSWRQGDDEQRARIAEKPMLFLRTLDATDTEREEEGGPAQSLVDDLRVLAAVAARASRRLDDHLWLDLTATARSRVRRRLDVANSQFASLVAHFSQEQS